jgi:hypothetical protein
MARFQTDTVPQLSSAKPREDSDKITNECFVSSTLPAWTPTETRAWYSTMQKAATAVFQLDTLPKY